MRRKSHSDMHCSVGRALDVVGDPWTLLIVRDALWGYRRFNDFQERLNIPRNTLSTRLAHLVETGILSKHPYGRRPERFEYQLTDKGRALGPVIVALLVWGDDWADLPEPPVSFIDRETGDVLDPVLVDRTSGRPWSEIRVQPVANDPHAPVTRSAGDPL